jgi:hypothetical protein
MPATRPEEGAGASRCGSEAWWGRAAVPVPRELAVRGVTPQDWANHCFGCRAVVYQICAVAMSGGGSGGECCEGAGGTSLLHLLQLDPLLTQA